MNAITITAGSTPSRATLIRSLKENIATALDHSGAVEAVEALQRVEAALPMLFPPAKPTTAKRTILPLVRELRRNAAERDAIDKSCAVFSPEAERFGRLMDREEALLKAVMLATPVTLAEAAHQLDAALDCIGTATEDGDMPERLREDLAPAIAAVEACRAIVLRHAGLSSADLWSRVNTDPDAEPVKGGAA